MELAEIQAVYYMVAATGVLVAAFYYVYNMRVSQKNQELSLKTQELALKTQQQNLETRRIGLVDSIITRTTSIDFCRNGFELLRYEWTDYAARARNQR